MKHSSEIRICGNCGQQNRIVHSEQRCSGCNGVAFSMTDPDEGTAKHFIPSAFFKKGKYEVWASKSYQGGAPIVKICDGLSLEAAKKFSWPNREIRLNGRAV